MIKKVRCAISLIMALVMLFASAVNAGSVFIDADDSAPYIHEAKLLKSLNILSGDTDGSLRPDDNLTRAEFAKLSVCMIDKQNEAMSNSGTSAFTDVYSDHWALRYINYVSQNQIILGYPDGSFHPDENISFAQAVTITLRTLGYSAQQIGDFWPDNYIQKAYNIGLTEDMNYSADDAISRADTVLMLGRALEKDMAQGSGQTLLDSFGYSVLEDVIIISSYENDKSLAADQIKTNQATYKTLTKDVFSMVGDKVKLYLDDEKRVILALPAEQADYTLTVQKVLGNDEYTCTSSESYTEFNYSFDDNLTMYYEGKAGSYFSMKQYIESGSIITLKGRYDGMWEYAILEGAAKITPVIATRGFSDSDTYIGSVKIENKDTLKVYRDGYRATLEDIQRNDVIYYNPQSNTVDVYIDKVTGTYDKAYPNKAHVTQIEVGGNVYNIETSEAASKLDESAGSYKINSRITLLLGKNGDVAGVTTLDDSMLDYAVVINTSTQMSEEEEDKGKQIKKVKVMQSDGHTYTYEADKDYSNYKGCLVKMSFESGVVSLSKVISNELSGYLSVSESKIDKYTIADGAAIFDLQSNESGQDAVVKKLDLQDISRTYMYKGDIIAYAVTNSFGDIGVIMFDNITNSDIEYGILTSFNSKDSNSSISGSYTINVRGKETTYVKNGAYGISVGTPVKVTAAGASLEKLESLTKVATGNKVDAVDYNRIKVGSTVYKMAEDAVIYKKDATTMKYVTLSQNDLISSRVIGVELWADASVSSGGVVRIIKIEYSR